MRTVVVMSDVMGMEYAEIASSTGTALGTVKSRLSRARARMRDCLRHGENWELLPRAFRLEEETAP
jgi:RNA polymerase sigma-70 factor (ECF subfamily)